MLPSHSGRLIHPSRVALLIGMVILGSWGCATPSEAADPLPDAGWPMYNMTYDGIRASPLKQITLANVGSLRPVCRVKVGEEGTFQSGPVVFGDTLVITTPHSTAALDATTCKQLWRHADTVSALDVYAVNRGAAYSNGRLFRGTPDGRLYALNSSTGQVVWNTQVGDPKLGEFTSSAPIAWGNTVFIGIAGSDWGVRGRVMGFDAATGKEKWRFWTIPMGKEPGAETWRIPATAKRGGGAMWTSYTLDTAAAELFVPVANPSPDFAPETRPGDNLYTNSVVVLDANTGALKWWYQIESNDGFDYDLGAAPILHPVSNGASRVLLASKDGNVYSLDRQTHLLKFKTPITTISSSGPAPTPTGVHACPGSLGGVEWNGPSFDARSRTLYVGAVDLCGVYKSGHPEVVRGGYYGTSWKPAPTDTATGWLTAVDAETGNNKWRFHAPAPIVAGVTNTAGGLVLTGDLAGNLYAFDKATGKVAFQRNLGGSIAGGVVTYASHGTQYVAATAGSIARFTFKTAGSPTLVILALRAQPATAGDTGTFTSLGDESGGSDTDPPAVTGKKVFAMCVACHGARGEGGIGANLQKSTKDLASVVAYIKAPTGSMPKLYPGSLTAKDVDNVAAYVMTLRQR